LVKYRQSALIQENNLEILYYEAGKANQPVIIMIHGLGDEADTWRHVFPPLSEKYHTIALDLPGFGRSAQPDRNYSPKFFMDSILGLMDHLNIQKAILMGNSLGGMLSHEIAIKYPDRVQGLILVDGTLLQHKPPGDWRFRLMQLPFLGEWLYNRLRKDPEAAYNSLGSFYHNLDQLPKADRDFLFHRVNKRVWSDEQRRAYFSSLRNMTSWIKMLQSDLPGKLAELETPTLIIRGEHDLLFTKENAEGVKKVQPNAVMETIDGVGHLPHQEDPTTFNDIVLTWLNRRF
jgi:pimeloyl-ACP methyl ester carboxylesterase